MNGAGNYSWVGLDGELMHATNWADLPAEMEFLVNFEPAYPLGPHTQEEHDYMATFDGKLREVLKTCRR